MAEVKITEREFLEAFLTSCSIRFTRYFFEKRFKRRYIVAKHHELIGDALNKVLQGQITRLMINIFPRSGKTELAVKNFIALGFAINPASKFIHLTCSNDLALDNSESVRDDFIKNEDYQAIFPYVQINKSSTAKNKWYTTAGGGVYAVATGGAVTGFGAGEIDDITDEELDRMMEPIEDALDEFIKGSPDGHIFNGAIIIDDPLKPDDAFSDTVREKINRRWINTIKSRINSIRTPIIIIGQRLHPNDFCGHVLELEGRKEDGGEWEVLSIPALYFEDGKYKSIWESKMPVEELLKLKESDKYTFESQFQQDPVSEIGKLFPKSELNFHNPETFKLEDYSIIVIDPADTGDDFTAVIGYLINGVVYIDHFICNNKGLDQNIPDSVDFILKRKPAKVVIEGNGGWIQTAKDIAKAVREKNNDIDIRIINSGQNKEEKIRTQAYYVKKRCSFRKDYEAIPEYKKAIDKLAKYLSNVRGQKDDVPDALSIMIIDLRNNALVE